MQNFFGDGLALQHRDQYATQAVQDGTGRVVELAREFVGGLPFILSYGDILVEPANYQTAWSTSTNDAKRSSA